MRVFMLTLFAIVAGNGVVQSQEKSALDQDATGWIDLFPDKEFTNWKRVALDLGLVEKSPWSVNGEVLVCLGAGGPGAPVNGSGAKEMLLYDKPFEDGVFHLEFRFQPLEGNHSYNSGAYVRSLDGMIWHQVQIAHLEIPPFMGDVFHIVEKNGKTEREIIQGAAADHIKPPGQWNMIEIAAKGKEIQVRMNGHLTLTWQECAVSKGLVGMQSEFYNIEFRNLKFKPLKD